MNQAEKRMNDYEKGQKVLEILRAFIKEHDVHGEESVYQRDDILIAAPDLVCDLCNVVDEYAKVDDEEEYIVVSEDQEPSSNGHYIGLDR